jgi:hypothetical protein
MCSQKDLAKPHSKILTKYLKTELYSNILSEIMIFCREIHTRCSYLAA